MAASTEILLGIVVAVVGMWLVLVLVMLVARPEAVDAREALRVLPDTLRLVRRLATDRTVPAAARWRLRALLVYLASPIDLVPDFIPILGHIDDVVVVLWGIRSVVRRVGRDGVERNWPGSVEGLETLLRVAGVQGRG